MNRSSDPRGANRRGAGWGDDIGYSAERTTATPQPRHVAPAPGGPTVTPFVPVLATFDDGTQAVIVPLSDSNIGAAGTHANGQGWSRRVVEVKA